MATRKPLSKLKKRSPIQLVALIQPPAGDDPVALANWAADLHKRARASTARVDAQKRPRRARLLSAEEVARARGEGEADQ